jgi:hypothetical protein
MTTDHEPEGLAMIDAYGIRIYSREGHLAEALVDRGTVTLNGKPLTDEERERGWAVVEDER